MDVFARISYGLARTPALPLLAACLGAAPPMVGLIGAAATVTGVVLKLPAGAISDVVGRRPILFGGLFVFATGPLLYFLAAGAWALVGIRLYHGLATALFGPVAMAAVAALAADRRGEYLSWLSNSKICGKLLGAFGGGLILWLAAEGLSSTGSFHGAISRSSLASANLTLADFHLVYGVCAVFGTLALALGSDRAPQGRSHTRARCAPAHVPRGVGQVQPGHQGDGQRRPGSAGVGLRGGAEPDGGA